MSQKYSHFPYTDFPYIDDFCDDEVFVFSTMGQGPAGEVGNPGPQGEKGDPGKDGILSFDTVTDMQASTDLEVGMTVRTNGFHEIGDGGAAYYTISASGTANEMDVLTLQGELFATFVATKPYVTPEQFGAYGDGINIDTNALAYILSKHKCVNFTSNKTYLIDNTITVSLDNSIIDGNSSKLYCSKELDGSLVQVSADNVIIRNCEIASISSLANSGIQCSYNNVSCCIKSCVVHGFGYFGIGAFSIIKDNYVYDCCNLTGLDNGHGYVYVGRDYCVVEGNHIICSGGDGLDHAVYIGGTIHSDFSVINNIMECEAGSNIGPLLALYPPSEIGAHVNVTVIGNKFLYANHSTLESRACVAISAEKFTFNGNVLKCNSNDVTLWAIFCKDGTIDGNTFNGTVQLSGISDVAFTGNRVDGRFIVRDYTDDDNVNHGSSSIAISGNVYHSDNSVSFEIVGNATAIDITNNTFEKVRLNSNAAIANCRIVENIFIDCDNYAISLSGCTYTYVLNNYVIGTGASCNGITFNPASNGFLIGNYVNVGGSTIGVNTVAITGKNFIEENTVVRIPANGTSKVKCTTLGGSGNNASWLIIINSNIYEGRAVCLVQNGNPGNNPNQTAIITNIVTSSSITFAVDATDYNTIDVSNALGYAVTCNVVRLN